MTKKILFFVGCIFFSTLNYTHIIADEIKLVPKKKPSLTKKEIDAKISLNILKPLPKPKKEIQNQRTENIAQNQKKKQKNSIFVT